MGSKKRKANVRISPAVKDFLTNVFDEGNKDGKPKANPTEIAEEIKQKFKRDEWLETQTVKGFFSRLAARQRGQEIGSQQDQDQDLALEREVFLQHLEQQVNREVGLGHPVEYKDVNLCQLYHRGRFEQSLKKGSGRARKRCRGKHETESSVFPYFLSALPLPKCFTTEQSTVETSLFVLW